MNTDEKLDHCHDQAAAALEQLAKLFTPEMKLSFIARHPTNPECFVIVGNDNVVGLACLLTREATKNA